MMWLIFDLVLALATVAAWFVLRDRQVTETDELGNQVTRTVQLSSWRIPGVTLGALVTIVVFLSLSFVNVPSDKVGHMKRIYFGRHMPSGRVIALEGQKGNQAYTLAPGFHFIPLIDVIFDVEMKNMITVPEGQYAILVARDGRTLTKGQYLADKWPEGEEERFLDAAYFMGEGADGPRGQRGPQLDLLRPGRYRINLYLFDVKLADQQGRPLYAIDVPAGFVGVVKSNVGPEYDTEPIVPTSVVEAYTEEVRLEASRRHREEVRQEATRKRRWESMSARIRSHKDTIAHIVDQPGEDAAPTREAPAAAQEDAPATADEVHRQLNPVEVELSADERQAVVIEAKKRALRALSVPIVPKGSRGVWRDVITPGRYYLNAMAYETYLVDTRIQTWEYAGGYTRRWINLKIDQNGTIAQESNEEQIPKKEGAADAATLIRVEGWDVFLDSRILMQVTPENAPYVVASVGGIQEAEDKIITPAYKSVSRNVIGHEDRRALDILYHREALEQAVEVRIIPEGKKAGIIIREIRFGDPMVPPELLLPGKRRQLAEQLKATYEKEQEAQTERIETEKKRAMADQQPKLIEARIAKEAASERKEEQRLLGEGEELRLKAVARGENARKQVLGAERTTELAMMKMLLEAIQSNPELVKVPSTLVTGAGGGGSLEGAAAILGNSNFRSAVDALSGSQ
jgi:hypothetical protein